MTQGKERFEVTGDVVTSTQPLQGSDLIPEGKERSSENILPPVTQEHAQCLQSRRTTKAEMIAELERNKKATP